MLAISKSGYPNEGPYAWLHQIAFDLLFKGNLSPKLRLKIKDDSVSSLYQSPFVLHGRGVKPPIILSCYVIKRVNVLYFPSHF